MDYNASGTGSVDSAVVNVVESVCHPLVLPSVTEYFTAFNLLGVALFSLGALAVVITLTLYIDTVRHILRFASGTTKTHSCFVISVYPVVSVVTYCAIIVPRAQLIAESVSQGMFMFSMYQLFCLVIAYAGGESALVKRLSPTKISLQVAPCCCCLPFLPTFELTKTRLKILRALVLQLPIVQSLIYLSLLVMWAEEQALVLVNYNFFQPVIISSILIGIWGMVMTVKMCEENMKEYYIKPKFLVLQSVLLLCKFQGLAARTTAMSNVFPCRHPITPTVYANLIYNSVILWEMALLACFARILYKKQMPESYQMDKNSNLPKQICSLEPPEKISITPRLSLPDTRNPAYKKY